MFRRSAQARHCAADATVIVEELGIREGRARIDLAVVNGSFHGYEIKSAADTLRRLPTQVNLYGQVLDFAGLVVAERHLRGALAIVPSWWDIVVAYRPRRSIVLEPLRQGSPNECVDKRALVELLWHDDALQLLRRHDAVAGLAGKRRVHAWERIVEVCTLSEIRDEVRAQLKRRAGRGSARPRR